MHTTDTRHPTPDITHPVSKYKSLQHALQDLHIFTQLLESLFLGLQLQVACDVLVDLRRTYPVNRFALSLAHPSLGFLQLLGGFFMFVNCVQVVFTK